MKVLLPIIIIVAASIVIFLLFDRNTSDESSVAVPRTELLAWSAFLHDSQSEHALEQTENFLRKVVGGDELDLFLGKHPTPGKFSFSSPSVNESDFRDMESLFPSIAAFREFLELADDRLLEIKKNINNLPEKPFFPRTLVLVEDLVSPTDTINVFSDKVYLPTDFERFSNLARFAEAFREDATTSGWVDYNDYFRNARKGSAVSIISYIATMPDIREIRFTRSAGEQSLANLLLMIRDKYPSTDANSR